MAKGAESSRRKAPLGGQVEKEKVEYYPSEREDSFSDELEEDYAEDELSPANQEFDISEEDDEENVIMDNLAPMGVGIAGGAKPPPKVDKVPREKRPAKERRPKERPHTANAPEKTPSFMESLTNEERHIYLALDANKEAQMLYILNLGKERAKGSDGHWSMGRGLVQVNQLPTPSTYDGAYEQSGQKFRQWLTTMEVHL
ncbi:unnamed protein product [Calypogeia fissa]